MLSIEYATEWLAVALNVISIILLYRMHRRMTELGYALENMSRTECLDKHHHSYYYPPPLISRYDDVVREESPPSRPRPNVVDVYIEKEKSRRRR